MKTKYIMLISLIITQAFYAFKPAPINYQIDPAKSKIDWTGYAAAGAYAPTGTIKIKSGNVTITDGKLKAAKVVIDMSTLSHDNADLQKHLKSDDFFGVEKNPEAFFVLASVTNNIATGSLTIKGIAKNISFPFVVTNKSGATEVIAELKIDRTLFGIKYNSSSYFQDLGSYAIKNEFTLKLRLSCASE